MQAPKKYEIVNSMLVSSILLNLMSRKKKNRIMPTELQHSFITGLPNGSVLVCSLASVVICNHRL